MTPLTPEAQAIVAAHPNLALPVIGEPALNYSREHAVYRHAKQACLALGFIEIDAECVALAWLAQTQRTGRFDPQAWPDEPADFGLRPWPRDDAFPPCPKALGLYAVLPDAQWVGRVARAAADDGHAFRGKHAQRGGALGRVARQEHDLGRRAEEREAVGIKNSLVRYAVGIEDTDDVVADALQAFSAL